MHSNFQRKLLLERQNEFCKISVRRSHGALQALDRWWKTALKSQQKIERRFVILSRKLTFSNFYRSILLGESIWHPQVTAFKNDTHLCFFNIIQIRDINAFHWQKIKIQIRTRDARHRYDGMRSGNESSQNRFQKSSKNLWWGHSFCISYCKNNGFDRIL